MKFLKLSLTIITLVMLVHTINGVFIEPRYLGFTSPADYADPFKLAAASQFWSWKLSGILHLLTRIALLIWIPALKATLCCVHSDIETILHYWRDVTLNEDAIYFTIGNGVRLMENVNNLIIALIRQVGIQTAALARRFLAAYLSEAFSCLITPFVTVVRHTHLDLSGFREGGTLEAFNLGFRKGAA